MENKQTAVDWLIKELKHVMDAKEAMGTTLDVEDLEYYRPLAKEMHAKQIMNSYNDGYRDGMTDLGSNEKDISEFSNAKLYYHETYGK